MHSMALGDAREFLRQHRFGVLSLSHERDAYGLPLFYGYDGGSVYFHTLPGAKSRYIASTHDACLTVASIHGMDDWASVQVFGPLLRIDRHPSRLAGMHALMSVPMPPKFGFTPRGEPKHADVSAIYQMRVARISGRFSARQPTVAKGADPALAGS